MDSSMPKKTSIVKRAATSSGKKRPVRDLVVTAATAGVATGVATQALGSGPLATAVVTALATLSQAMPMLSGQLARDWTRDRQERWFEGWLRGSTASAEAARDEFVEQLATPGVRDVIFDHLRRIEEALDEAALPLLGALARSYVREGRKPDAFFRNASRFLAELDGPMARDMATLCAVIDRPGFADTRIHLRVGEMGSITTVFAPSAQVFARAIPYMDSLAGPELALGELSSALPLLSVMRRHGISLEGYPGYIDVRSGPHMTVVESSVLARLRPIVAG